MTTPYETEPGARNYDGTGEVNTRPMTVVEAPREEAREPSYLREDAQAEMNSRWQQVQSEFVDDPRKSVAHAHQLVSDAVQRIVDTFTEERNQLERQWSEGEDVSTEDLRVCLQRYRAFFTRLLPLEAARS